MFHRLRSHSTPARLFLKGPVSCQRICLTVPRAFNALVAVQLTVDVFSPTCAAVCASRRLLWVLMLMFPCWLESRACRVSGFWQRRGGCVDADSLGRIHLILICCERSIFVCHKCFGFTAVVVITRMPHLRLHFCNGPRPSLSRHNRRDKVPDKRGNTKTTAMGCRSSPACGVEVAQVQFVQVHILLRVSLGQTPRAVSCAMFFLNGMSRPDMFHFKSCETCTVVLGTPARMQPCLSQRGTGGASSTAKGWEVACRIGQCVPPIMLQRSPVNTVHVKQNAGIPPVAPKTGAMSKGWWWAGGWLLTTAHTGPSSGQCFSTAVSRFPWDGGAAKLGKWPDDPSESRDQAGLERETYVSLLPLSVAFPDPFALYDFG